MIQELIYNECVFSTKKYRQNLKKVVESRGRKYEKNKIVLASKLKIFSNKNVICVSIRRGLGPSFRPNIYII